MSLLITRISILFLFFTLSNLIAESSSKKLSPAEFFELNEDAAKRVIDKLSKQDTEELITQVRVIARENYKQADKFYFLISHLERISAISEEQSRLEALNSVYLFGIIFITSFLGYLLISQRRMIKSIQNHLPENKE